MTINKKNFPFLALGILLSLFFIGEAFAANNFAWSRSEDVDAGSDIVGGACIDSTYAYFIGMDNVPGNSQWRIEKVFKSNGTSVSNYTSNPSAGSDQPSDCTMINNGTKVYLYVVGFDDVVGTDNRWRIEKIDPDIMLNRGNYTLNPTGEADHARAVTNNGTHIYVAGQDATGDAIARVMAFTSNLESIHNYTSNPSAADQGFDSIFYDATSDFLYVGGSNGANSKIDKLNRTLTNFANSSADYQGTTGIKGITVVGDFVYAGHTGTTGMVSKNSISDLSRVANASFAYASGSTNIYKLSNYSSGRLIFANDNNTHRNLTVIDNELTRITSFNANFVNAVNSWSGSGSMGVDGGAVFIGGRSTGGVGGNQWDLIRVNMSSAFLVIKAFNERNTSQRINFDLTINNGTCEFIRADIDIFVSDYSDAGLCLNRTTISIGNDSDGAFTWPSRNYIVTLTNDTNQDLNAYLLRDDQGVTHQFIVTTFQDVPIENATVEIRRFIGTTYTPVSSCSTDTSGTCTHFMDSSITYQVVVSADGYTSAVFFKQASVISTQTFVRLRATGSTGASIINLTTAFEGISWSITPTTSIQNTTFNISFFISADNGDLSWFALNVTYRNVSNRTFPFSFTNISTSPTGGTIVITINSTTNASGWYDANATFALTNTSYVQLPLKTYFLTNGTGVSGFNPFDGVVSIDSYRLVALITLAIATGFFSKFGFFAGWLGGISVMAFMTLGLNIFPWEWLALAFVVPFALIIFIRRV